MKKSAPGAGKAGSESMKWPCHGLAFGVYYISWAFGSFGCGVDKWEFPKIKGTLFWGL